MNNLIEFETDYFYSSGVAGMLPEDFEYIAQNMRDRGILSLSIRIDGHDGYLRESGFRLETEKEKEDRLALEKIIRLKNAKNEASEKIKLIKKAKALGLKVIDQRPILSNYDRVYWVQKGMDLSNSMDGEFIVPKDGYIWYDEVGALGDKKVYASATAANKILSKYVKEVLK